MKKILIMLMGLFLLVGFVNAAGSNTQTSISGQRACTMDAKQCPDGSFVGRIGPNCEFSACAGNNLTPINYYKNITLPCSSVPLVDVNKCCQEKGYTMYSYNIKACIIKPVETENGTYVLFNKTINIENVELHTILFNKTVELRIQNSTEARQHIEQIINKTQLNYQKRIAMLENLTFTISKDGVVIASGKYDAKMFGWFKFKHKYFCKITENGVATRKHMIWDMFIKDNNIDMCGVKECFKTKDCWNKFQNCYYICSNNSTCDQIQTTIALKPYPDCSSDV